MMSMVLRTTWKALLVVLTLLTTFGVPLFFLYEVSVQQNVLLDMILMCDAFGLALLYGSIMVWVIEEVVRRPRRAVAEPDSVR
jgi:hypothetical protein